LAHWSQYQRITHRLTSPHAIEIAAECDTQDEHRILLDWCTWITKEVEGIAQLLPASRRHGHWSPPKANISETGTIRIKPSDRASYIPSEWKIELDTDAVLERLIKDVYRDRLAFLRELVQNAIDATRTQLYLDLAVKGKNWPEWPTQLSPEFRDDYPIRINLTEQTIYNALSTQDETVQELEIEDFGTGMSIAIIKDYFLQVGRSYYQTATFRRRFSFSPIGRHGVGFLSVFAASEHVVVDTRWQNDASGPESHKMTFNGPRSYFLLEKGSRNARGTSIRLRLRQPISPGAVEVAVRGLCRRVEFPVELNLLGRKIRIDHEQHSKWISSEQDVSDTSREFSIIAFPIEAGNIRGELYVFETRHAGNPSWADWSWANYTYKQSHPLARIPLIPQTSICDNGLDYANASYVSEYRRGPLSIRIDYRGPQRQHPLDRGEYSQGLEAESVVDEFPDIKGSLEQILESHLLHSSQARSSEGWMYLQRLMDYFPLPEYWAAVDSTLRCWKTETARVCSLNEFVQDGRFVVAQSVFWSEHEDRIRKAQLVSIVRAEEQASSQTSDCVLTRNDLFALSDNYKKQLFAEFVVDSVNYIDHSGVLLVLWSRRHPRVESRFQPFGRHRLLSVPISGFPLVAAPLFGARSPSYSDDLILNSSHPFSEWLDRALQFCKSNALGLTESALEPVVELIRKACRYRSTYDMGEMQGYLARWAAIDRLPGELRPPPIASSDLVLSQALPE
jgi:hypothetical protein